MINSPKKDLDLLYLRKIIKDALREIDRDQIHILYFKNYVSIHNIWHYPLNIPVKLYNLFTGKPQLDHVAHISRFVFDEWQEEYFPKLFEATIRGGMDENDLFDKLKNFEGVCFIETLPIKVDKVKAKAFEDKYSGVPYSEQLAALSGIEKTINIGNNGGFCSWLESLFLKDQGIDLSHIQNGNPYKITPAELFNADLGNKRILYKS